MTEDRATDIAPTDPDLALARDFDGKNFPHWADQWPDIGRLQRKGLVRVKILSPYQGQVVATGLVPPARPRGQCGYPDCGGKCTSCQ